MTSALQGVQPGSQGTITLGDGTTVELPLLTYRAEMFSAFFTISAAKARALLPPDDLRHTAAGVADVGAGCAQVSRAAASRACRAERPRWRCAHLTRRR